ncbi:hypothetical protein [Streptomyces sp. NPDC046197]|uniref:hypothetical protein n=1 Tax=Streptomyces sp. NPDC046197 TaxID=3154337 RepID=UPI0033C1E6F4
MLALRLTRAAHPAVQLRRLTVAAASAGTGFLMLCTLGYALGHPDASAAAVLRLAWCAVPLAATVYLAVAVSRTDPGTRPRPGLSALGLGPGRLMAVSAATTAVSCTLGSLLALFLFLFLRGDPTGTPFDGATAEFLAVKEPLPIPAALTLLTVVPVTASVSVVLVLRPRDAKPATAGDRPRGSGRLGAYRRTGSRETFGANRRTGPRQTFGAYGRFGARPGGGATGSAPEGGSHPAARRAGKGAARLTTHPAGSRAAGAATAGTEPGRGGDWAAAGSGAAAERRSGSGTAEGTAQAPGRSTGLRTAPGRVPDAPSDPSGAALDPERADADPDPHRPPAPRRPPVGLPWGITVLAAGLAVEAYASRSTRPTPTASGPALPGGLAADSAPVLVGWLLTALGLALAGPGLTHLCGRLLQSVRPGALRLLAGRVLMEEAGRIGRPLGIVCAVASGTYAMIALYDGSAPPFGPLTAFGTALVGGCTVATLLTAAVEARQSRTGTTAALLRLGATATVLRAAAALRVVALLAVFTPLTLVIAELAALPLAR